jgi:hypothetical protein
VGQLQRIQNHVEVTASRSLDSVFAKRTISDPRRENGREVEIVRFRVEDVGDQVHVAPAIRVPSKASALTGGTKLRWRIWPGDCSSLRRPPVTPQFRALCLQRGLRFGMTSQERRQSGDGGRVPVDRDNRSERHSITSELG